MRFSGSARSEEVCFRFSMRPCREERRRRALGAWHGGKTAWSLVLVRVLEVVVLQDSRRAGCHEKVQEYVIRYRLGGDVFEAGLVDFGSFVFCEPLPRFL